MKTKPKNMQKTALLLCLTLLAGTLAACGQRVQTTDIETASTANISDFENEPTANKPIGQPEGGKDMEESTRTYHVSQLGEIEKQYKNAPGNASKAIAYAEALLLLGDLADAKNILEPLLAEEAPSPEAIYLTGRIEYLSGNYETAEGLYSTLLDQFPEYQEEAVHGLEYVYYQTNQYQKAQTLPDSAEKETNIGSLMRAFGDMEPYQVRWTGDEEETAVPFLDTEPLPVVQVEVNGAIQNFIIDTGASETYIDESLAASLRIEPIATQTIEYAGGVSVETNYSVLDSMALSGVILESVPVNIASLEHFAGLYGGDFEISGVFGTGVFKQFETTINYLDSELTLKSRTGQRGSASQGEPGAIEVPFILADTHFILCKAQVNGKEVSIFPDSGLAADASLLLPKGTMEYAGISAPELHNAADELDAGGLGGADFSIGYFTANTFEMGDLPAAYDVKGMFGVFPENYYLDEDIGLFVDGIISHNYLKDYSWTIDFDRMTMTFHK